MEKLQPSPLLRRTIKGIGVALGISLGGAAALEGCAPQPPQAQAQVREAQPVLSQPPSTPEARIVMPAIGRVFTQTAESAPAAVPSATPPEPPKQPIATPKAEPDATAEPSKPPSEAKEPADDEAEVKNQPTCTFIKDPKLCLLGQPMTRAGWKDQIMGVEYNNIPDTPIYTRAGYFSAAKDSKTGKIVGASIDFSDGSSIDIRAEDLAIENPFSREVKADDVVARVGKSGYVSFSTGAQLDPKTGQYSVPQSFFEDNFPPEVIRKTKKIIPAAVGPSRYAITDRYSN